MLASNFDVQNADYQARAMGLASENCPTVADVERICAQWIIHFTDTQKAGLLESAVAAWQTRKA